LEIPLPLLEYAAPGYLSAFESDMLEEDWLKKAFQYCGGSLHGARGPLTKVRPRDDSDSHQYPHYRLADYLEQHGKETRQDSPFPASFLTACARHAHQSSCRDIAHQARDRGLYELALTLYQRSGDSDDADRVAEIAAFFKGIGRLDDAIAWHE